MGVHRNRVSRLHPRNERREGVRPAHSPEGSMQVRSDLFTSAGIDRKCLASTYQGWGLQSLVSEEKTEEREGGGRKKRKEVVSVLFFPSLFKGVLKTAKEHV